MPGKASNGVQESQFLELIYSYDSQSLQLIFQKIKALPCLPKK
jgi:hypothetical protein